MIGLNKPYSSNARYYINGQDITWYVVNDLKIPAEYGERYFEIEVR